MGLDIQCKCGQHDFRAGSYSGFHWFRVQLAKSMYNMDYDRPSPTDWDWFSRHILSPFWLHSDCDGTITSKQCQKMLPEWKRACDFLIKRPYSKKEAFKRLFRNGIDPSEEQYFLSKMNLWLSIIQHCAETKCKIIFC